MLLLASMFVAVHRGARGRALAEAIGALADRQAMAEVERSELRREIEQLRGRSRIVRAGERLGLRLPDEEELVILDLGMSDPRTTGSASR
jgi:hypothetical protein